MDEVKSDDINPDSALTIKEKEEISSQESIPTRRCGLSRARLAMEIIFPLFFIVGTVKITKVVHNEWTSYKQEMQLQTEAVKNDISYLHALLMNTIEENFIQMQGGKL